MQIRRVVKQGGSLLVVLPKRYTNALGIRVGDYVMFEHKGKYMEVRRHDYRSDVLGK